MQGRLPALQGVSRRGGDLWIAVALPDGVREAAPLLLTEYNIAFQTDIRLFERVIDNSKILAATGLSQGDLMPLAKGLETELAKVPCGQTHGDNSIGTDSYRQGAYSRLRANRLLFLYLSIIIPPVVANILPPLSLPAVPHPCRSIPIPFP